jgi:hypothetical protein
MLKKFFLTAITLFCLIFMVSCTSGTDVENPAVPPGQEGQAARPAAPPLTEEDREIADLLGEITADVAVRSGGEAMEISWGYGHIPGQDTSNTNLPDDSAVIKALNEQFNVVLKGVEIPFENNMYYGNWEAVSPLPDVLIVAGDTEYAYGTGNFRSIPRMIIERHAPNYTNLLNGEPYSWDLNKAPGSNDLWGLGAYGEISSLQLYSAWRLDWLKQAGFELPEDMVEISPGQYFSPTPFTVERVYEAMRAFMSASSSTPEHYGLVIPYSNDIRSVISANLPNLASIWGLVADNMNDGGKVNMYYAMDEYKQFLALMADFYEQGFLALKGTEEIEYYLGSTSATSDDGGKNINYEVGYWPEFTMMLVDDSAWYSEGRLLMDTFPGAEILYTPPEVGSATVMGPPPRPRGFLSAGNNLLMIRKNVSDEKLAVILEIFDACAFDRETKVLATYGFEGENFEWAGEPYNSFVNALEDSPTFNNGNHLLNPPIYGGPAYNEVYDSNINPNNPVYIHSISDEGRARNILNYKSDFTGEFNGEVLEWESAHYADIRRITTDYFYAVVQGEKDIDSTWDAYIEELNTNGLPEYLAIMEQWEDIE